MTTHRMTLIQSDSGGWYSYCKCGWISHRSAHATAAADAFRLGHLDEVTGWVD